MSGKNAGGGGGGAGFTGYLPESVYTAYYRGLLEAVARKYHEDLRLYQLHQQQQQLSHAEKSGGGGGGRRLRRRLPLSPPSPPHGHLVRSSGAANLNKINGSSYGGGGQTPPLSASAAAANDPETRMAVASLEDKQLALGGGGGGGGAGVAAAAVVGAAVQQAGSPGGQITFRPHSDIIPSSSSLSPPPPCNPPQTIIKAARSVAGHPRKRPPSGSGGSSRTQCKRRRVERTVVAKIEPPQPQLESSASSPHYSSSRFDVGRLLPELLESIFRFLDVRSRGRAAQVCRAWRDVLAIRSIWRHTEARLHLNRTLQRPEDTYRSMVRRGVTRVKVLSIKKSLRRLFHFVPSLVSVDLSGCYNLTESVMEGAIQGDLPNLRCLDLGLCKDVGDGTLGRIGTYCSNLRSLSLEGNTRVTNAGLLLLIWGAKELTSLNLKSCRNITDNGINVIALQSDGSPFGSKLEHLGLQDCRLTDKSLAYISLGMPSLRRINLSTISGVTDTGLKSLAQMPRLEELNLRNCDNVTDLGLAYLADDGVDSRLKVLDLSFCSSITDSGLAHVANGLKELERLSICSCLVGDAGLMGLARGLPRLRCLDLGQCNHICEDGLVKMAAEAKSLETVDAYGCRNVSEGVHARLPRSVKCNRRLC